MEELKIKTLLSSVHSAMDDSFDDHCQVLSGKLSEVFYYLKYSQLFNDNDSFLKALDILNYHIETASNHVLNYKFAHGLPGISYLICFLNNKGILDDSILKNFREIDDAIEKSLQWDFSDNTFDYTVGLLGKMQYFFERGLTEANVKIIESGIDFLDRSAVRDADNGCSWLDNYTSYYDKTDREHIPYYNLGLAHGMGSIVYFLCKCYKNEIRRETCERLIHSSIVWLKGKAAPEMWPYIYPNIIYDQVNSPFIKDTQGWCHGVLSNSMSFLLAGRTLGIKSYLDEFNSCVKASTGIKIEHFSAQVSKETGEGVVDLAFCHGITGLIFFYDKLHLSTLNKDCRNMSNYWSDFFFEEIVPTIQYDKFYKYGIIGGLPGLGLTLMQKLEKGKSNLVWEKTFLLDLENF